MKDALMPSRLCFSVTCQEQGQVFTVGNDVKFALAVKDALQQHFPCSYWSVSPVIVSACAMGGNGDLDGFSRDAKQNQM